MCHYRVCVCVCVSDSRVMRLGLQPVLFQSSPILCCSHVCVCGGVGGVGGANDVVETHCYVFWLAMYERGDLRVK